MQNNQTVSLESERPMSKVSMSNGYWFYFKHNDNDISVHGSAWSGKESVFLNNHPISIKRNLTRFSGNHSFSEKGVDYRVQIKLTSFWKGGVSASLYADEELISTEDLAFIPNAKNGQKSSAKWRDFLWFLLVMFGVGLAVGYFVAKGASAFLGG